MSVDYSPLFTPFSREDVAQFKRESKETSQPWAITSTVTTVLVTIFVAVGAIMLIVILSTFVPIVVLANTTSGPDSGFGSFMMLVFPLAFLGLVAIVVYRFVFGTAGRWESLLRRTRFASANGLAFVPTSSNPDYPGVIFSTGDSRNAFDIYRSTTTPQFDIGNYRYTTGSGKERVTHSWGYLALRLERRLPQMLLDSRANNGLLGSTNLPASFRRDQRLSLEGDFDKYFALYCPKEYERDAFYVFTPDLMALLIDASSTFDVEIVDDWLLVYSNDLFELDKAAPVDRLLKIVDTVGAKALRQTDRYADERIGDRSVNLVAPQGQRLKRGTTLAGVGFVVAVAWIIFTFVRVWV